MQKGKKILLFFTVTLVLIIMVSLFYYSMRATIMEFLFENNQEQREKITSATGDQAQIIVDLANKQLAKQKQEIEIRQDEKENKSLFKELSGATATVKPAPEDGEPSESDIAVSGNVIASEATITTKPKPNKVQNGYVVVDCETGGVVACPHNEVQTGTSPMYYKDDKSSFVVGRCLDVSIDVKSFCK